MGTPEAEFVAARDSRRSPRFAASAALILLGLVIGAFALVLVSNRFGNTDTVGLLLLGIAGWSLATGVGHLCVRLHLAALIGIIGAPLTVFLLFALYWVALFATSFQNRHHQAFAAHGVSRIPPAAQMNELFADCRHYVTYGKGNVTMFNSIAYFGGRYELAMQVPVLIESESSGSTIGEPQFYLNEIRAVAISPSRQISASFSRNLHFGEAEWNRVYNADGDFNTIGFSVNPTPVANFRKYTDAARPSN